MKKATVITYGCQMNVNESAKMKKIFENLGYEITENIRESDAIFLNTCTVREGAATQIYGKLGELMQIKAKRGSIIGVTGCFAQEQGKELLKKFPVIDIVMGNQNIGRLPQAIENIENQTEKHVVFTDHEDDLPPRLDADFGSDQTASIAISYGCNNFCTFCIVPYVRGRERSVPLEEIVRDVEQYVKKGAKEIMLLGQNVNSYGHDFKNGDTFARLLTEICKVDGDFIVRFVSPHPRDFTDDVIDVIAKEEKIAKCLHLPLQSGSSQILKRMNRGYTKEQYLSLAHKIQNRIPGVALTTDIIVGFPGETEQDFLDTLEVVREINYDNAFMFMYSIRQGTRAATMQEQVPEDTKKERLQKLMDVQARCSYKESQKYQGKVVRVLVEGESKKNKQVLSGRTSTNKIVLFQAPISLKGSFVDVEIYECKTWTLYGKLV
ncbi:tRNA (N6-isopentenyl adenosine(37)-C2)-methylthiotransferase MiaB [Fusobacterium necrophorum]|uniref:tRNA-2-methylthio-N(6)-dimethylallyladenosine synthase n=3 Tax=Fusobacterium necrophorum TaxID=859 RepID=A0AAN4ATQ3_9FUSO|nr:tRNA (N6-isopentenyl adenosine(37)-C2)-methylthiotransferase MiaB [Fusobacterium necrophorum]AVQ20774.1 tRNA (N6-isopentenyl adenosine(37)-C2)-methylthiotransferase MiaB [Fusobacterium necrophorum subsp. funduliforme]AYV92444.1 tRNA (N6-isopentenyl adenosine(37)-C2)-methylthiotransferase MiaB [Fusobacterium necrophorum subsp. funduliforme]AYV94457.1 tRNA (N6-isopentenyl adenosine(37)-C2)-methylthiotransferase MiaB [Fusobacterium necrophorum subsp. funduliforme]EFS22429.1 tRNA-i(6)A37 thiotra